MFVFHSSFAAHYPQWNSVAIHGWRFEDLSGKPHAPTEGVVGNPPGLSGKKAWTASADGLIAPYHVQADGNVPHKVNVVVTDPMHHEGKLRLRSSVPLEQRQQHTLAPQR